MSDKPREWPYRAASARDRSAELAQVIDAQLGPLVDEDRIFTESEIFKRASRARAAALTILRLLEGVGAKTTPE